MIQIIPASGSPYHGSPKRPWAKWGGHVMAPVGSSDDWFQDP